MLVFAPLEVHLLDLLPAGVDFLLGQRGITTFKHRGVLPRWFLIQGFRDLHLTLPRLILQTPPRGL